MYIEFVVIYIMLGLSLAINAVLLFFMLKLMKKKAKKNMVMKIMYMKVIVKYGE